MERQGGRDAGQPRLYWVNKMKDENGNTAAGDFRGTLGGPILMAASLFVFLIAAQVSGQNGWTDELSLLALPATAAIGAALGRISSEHTSGIKVDRSIITSCLIILPLLGTLIAPVYLCLTLLVSALGTHILTSRGRVMEANLLIGVLIALLFAIIHSVTTATPDEAPVNATRAYLGAKFSTMFSVLAFGSIYGVLILSRTLDKKSDAGMLAEFPFELNNKSTHIAAGAFMTSLVIPMIWISVINDPQTYEEGAHLGPIWGLFSAAIVLIVAMFKTERWNVLAGVLALNWVLFSLGRLNDLGVQGFPNALSDDGSYSMVLWFLIVFWANVGIIMMASKGYIGAMAPLREHSALRNWWKAHNYTILVGMAVIVAFVIRVVWNVVPAMNAQVIGEWDMSGGSDPWYMKRIIDYVAVERAHLVFDADRNYPVGGLNPRPPLFSWSLAMGGIFLSWLTEMPLEEAVWWSVETQPAVWGALIVIPLAGMARRFHSPLAGIAASWLIALMPGHITHSTFGLADHDSFAMFFLTFGFYWWIRSMMEMKQQRIFSRTSWNPAYLLAGARVMWRDQKASMTHATMAGLFFAVAGLAWKGFVFAPGIIFLAYSGIVFLNLFRGRDALPITSAMLQMLTTSILIPLPFYIWPGMNLLTNPSGMAPLLYMLVFTIGLGYVVSASRDKPWLLVFTLTATLSGTVLSILYVLQALDYYAGWDILFTGGFYFSKNKVFSTIGEAQAPDRGILFASFGPIVTIAAIGYGLILMWRGGRKENAAAFSLGTWVVVASYMSWTAGRFIFNAAPPMAVVGGIGLTAMWAYANPSEFNKIWKRSGIGSPRARFNSTFSASRSKPGVPAALMVLLIVFSQHATYGIDSGIPRGDSSAGEVDEAIQGIMPDVLRYEVLGFSVLNSNQYNPDSRCTSGCWYLGTFGPGFNGGGWNMAYQWLSEQDSTTPFTERPAFLSWWDYGFQALAHGQHPTVADNFQSGIPVSGNMLLSSGQEDVIALMIMNALRIGGVSDEENKAALGSYLEVEQIRELERIHAMSAADVEDRSLALIHTEGDVQLLHGSYLDPSGIPLTPGWYVLEDGQIVGERMDDESTAMSLFNTTRSSQNPFSDSPTHYLFGDYRYTADLIDDYNDLSTGIHRNNAKLAVGRAFLTHVLELSDLVGLMSDLSSIHRDVQTYDGRIGDTVQRNTEVRYFAVDDRLYPLGGLFYEGYNYHGGQTTGIFYAPTTLAGLDPEDYISSSYLTRRGDGPIIPRSAGEYEQEYLDDIVRQQSGAITDQNQIISLEDINYVQEEAFFETFLARIYVGYGTTTLGLNSDNSGQPGPTWAKSGTPGTPLRNSYALPGAMMNHFVLANYYDEGSDYPDDDNDGTPDIYNWTDPRQDPSSYYSAIGIANSNVKILKYYSGASLNGQVLLENGEPVPNARILIERDAFSSEGDKDSDPRTYWIPISSEVADSNGEYSATVPAGKIRISAFYGNPDETAARTLIESGGFDMLSDITREQSNNEDRVVNPITAILGGVAGTSYLGASIVNVTGDEGHSKGTSIITQDIEVPAVTATGQLQWIGEPKFTGQAIQNATVNLVPSDPIATHPGYSISTSSGTIQGLGLYFQGEGTAVFEGEGQFDSPTPATATDFTGTLSQTIRNNQSVTGTGTFDGNGILSGTISDQVDTPPCEANNTMPTGSELCGLESGDILLSGSVNATGRFVSEGQSKFIRHYENSSFTAAGRFTVEASGSGTITGDGVFQGNGLFSGPMVREGTFHISGAIPGDYNVVVTLESGQEVEVGSQFSIQRTQTPETRTIEVEGISVSAVFSDEDGSPVTGTAVLTDPSSQNALPTTECAVSTSAPCYVSIDLSGALNIAPIPSSPHILSFDADSDGFYDLTVDILPQDAISGAVTLDVTVPKTYDLHVTLVAEDGSHVPELDLSLRGALDSEVYDLTFDNDSHTYAAELLPGVYLLNHTYEGTQIWERITISEDLHLTSNFRVSSQLNGTVYTSDDDDQPAPEDYVQFAKVTARWDGFEVSTTSDEEGEYQFTLPVGENVTITSTVGLGNLVDGKVIFTTENNPPLDLVTRKGYIYEGYVSVNRVNYLYNDGLVGWEPLTVIAENNTTEVTWTARVNEIGGFEIALPTGQWTVSLEGTNMDASTTQTVRDTPIELTLFPENSTLDVFAFIDNTRDGSTLNGTGVSVDFRIVSSSPDGIDLNFSTTSSGDSSVSLEPGSYTIETSVLTPDSTLFGTRILTGTTTLQVPLEQTSLIREIGFDPEGVVNVSIVDQLLSPIPGLDVKFRNLDRVPTIVTSLVTDENGEILAFLPEGRTLLEIDGYSPGDNTILGARAIINISAGGPRTTELIELTEMSTLNITLQDSYTSSGIPGQMIQIRSDDGLGVFKMPVTDTNGFTTQSIVAGNWSVSHDEESDGVRILVGDKNIGNIIPGEFADVTLIADKEIKLSGKVFWDFDKDNNADVAEGVSNATVHVTFGEESIEIQTNDNGQYETLVPSNTTVEVSASKDGFTPVTENLTILDTPSDLDLKLSAGTVTASGSISYLGGQINPEWISDLEIKLVPREGFAMPTVTVELDDSDQWDGTWSVNLEPGRYVLQVRDTSRNLVAFSEIFADLVNGGQADVDLTTGGWLVMSGSWIDYEGGLHTLSSDDLDLQGADVIEQEITVVLNSGPSTEWRLTLPHDGNIRLLLPTGAVSLSSDFQVSQMGRTMIYEAGQTVTIPSSTISDAFETAPLDLRYNRLSNSAISAVMVSHSSGQMNEDGIVFAEDDGLNGYSPIRVEIELNYEGHETSDEFDLRAIVPGTDGSSWSVTFDNGSGEFSETTSVTMSIEDDVKVVTAEITPPNASVARHFSNGRAISIQISSGTGVSESVEVKVNVDKQTGWGLTQEPDELYGVRPGSQETIQFTFLNEGNSDDTYSLNFNDDVLPEGWTRTGAQSITIGAFESQSVSVVLNAPSDASDDQFTLVMYVIGSDQTEYDPKEITVSAQFPDISIDEESVSWLSGGVDPVFGSVQTVVLSIENDGLVDADQVLVRADHKPSVNSPFTGINATTVVSVSAGGESTAYLDLNFTTLQQGEAWIVFSIESIDGEPSSEDLTKKFNLLSPSVEEAGGATQVLMIVLVIFLLGLLVVLTRRPGKKPNAPF